MSTAVIGAGIAGLSAAIEAARGSRPVVLLDARAHSGGRARTRDENGFRLNEGAHALYVDGEANAFLRTLGCEPAGGQPDTGNGIGVDGAVTGVLPTTLRTLLRTPLLKGDRRRMVAMFAGLGRLNPADYGSLTVDETVRELVGEGPAGRLVHALVRLGTYGADPGRASGDAGLMQLQMAVAGGVRYLDGGWQTIVDSLETEARALGVEIRRGTKVDRLRVAERGVELEIDGAPVGFDTVVLAVGGPRQVVGILGDQSAAAGRWAEAARPAGVAALDVGLGTEWGGAVPFALGIDDPLYLSVHAPVARLAPAGHTLVHVSRYLHPDEPGDPDRDRARCEELLDRVRPRWRDDATHVGFRRRLVAAFDQPRAADGGMVGRPTVRVPELDGVLLAGDWVGPTGLLADASVASGRAAGRIAAAVRSPVVHR